MAHMAHSVCTSADQGPGVRCHRYDGELVEVVAAYRESGGGQAVA